MNERIYQSENVKSVLDALRYTGTHNSGHRYLACRDIPTILQRYLCGIRALDYGTGTGYSANYLYELGLEVKGVDISENMLNQAAIRYPHIPFVHMETANIPDPDDVYDLVFSSFVLLEINKKQNLLNYFKEVNRVLKIQNGIFVCITGSNWFYSPERKWLHFETDFRENKSRSSGDVVKILLKDVNIEFEDYYWEEDDYKQLFSAANLHLLETLYPLGHAQEGLPWKDELKYPPYVIFIATPAKL